MKQRPPLDISYTLTDEAFPPLKSQKRNEGATQSTASETFDEETIQSAISSAIKTLQDQHRQELNQLRQQFEAKVHTMEKKILDIGEQVVAQTYQSLVQEDSPLATKADHMQLQLQINSIQTQLAQIIQMISKSSDHPNSSNAKVTAVETPPRVGHKRPNSNRTPEKPSREEILCDDTKTVSSATSDLDVGMEGCED